MENRTGKYIVFCANVEHMDDMISKAQDWFYKVDSKPHIYKAYSSDSETSKAFVDFKADNSEHLKLLYCIDMLNEGVHVEDISSVILLRPTVSPIVYKQQIGRALSASKSTNPAIFDIVNNIENLYSIDTVKEEMQTAIHYYHTHGGDGVAVNDTFELIDKVADCKSLFEELEGTLSASWEAMYEKAKAYFEEFGDLEVPKDYYTEDGCSLGIWIATQRAVYRGTCSSKGITLTQVQIDKLTAIGMRWERVNDISWEKYYEAAKKYVENHGDLLPTYQYIDEDGLRLGAWICSQRTARKNGITQFGLTEERIARLDEIGMVWDVPDYLWEEGYSAAVLYHKTHSNLNVPRKYINKNGFKLGTWINRQRTLKRNNSAVLTQEKIARLDLLGIMWDDKFEKHWNDGIKALRDYYKKYGTLQVPSDYISFEGIKLQAWICQQRNKYRAGRLSDEHIQILESMGFEFEVSLCWKERFSLAKKYYEEHRNLDVPSDYVIDGFKLHPWIRRQIRDAAKLSPKQIEILDSIGLFDERLGIDKIWYKRCEQAKAYFEEHGDLSIPIDYIDNGFHLGSWLIIQKKKRRSNELEQGKIELLDKLNIEWENRNKKANAELYEIVFQRLEQFIAEYGLEKVKSEAVCDDGYALGRWVYGCRGKYKAGKLAKKYIQRFVKLRFALDDAMDWEFKYQQTKAYLETHDEITLPNGILAEDGKSLSFWFAEQRRAYARGELTEDQMKKFDAIGYPFKPEISYLGMANRKKWIAKYEIVKEFLDAYSGEKLDPEVEYKGIKIIECIRQQCNFIQNGVFDDDRVDLFNALNWQAVLDNLITHWDVMYDAATVYFNEHGISKTIPKGNVVDGSELNSWLENERKAVNALFREVRNSLKNSQRSVSSSRQSTDLKGSGLPDMMS